MGRINTEATNSNTLYKRQRNLDKSTNNLNIIRMVLENLEEQGIDCPPIKQLYKREFNHNKRLANLVEGRMNPLIYRSE